MTSRRAAALLLGLLAAAALAAALAARLAPLAGEAGSRRAAELETRARAALEEDAARLSATARRLAADPALVEILEGGSAGVRPERLFALLEGALPREAGWGAVLLDRNGEAVAWAGDPGDLPAAGTPRAGAFSVVFRVTQLTLSHEAPIGRSPETRGAVVVTRRRPTGIVRPDLLESETGLLDPTVRRARVRAARNPRRLLAVELEPVGPQLEEQDIRRAVARRPALLGAVVSLLLGLVARSPGLAAVAARLFLALGAPVAETGPFARLFPDRTGLLASPVDVALTGLAALVVLGSALRRPPTRSSDLRLRVASAFAAATVSGAAAALGIAGGRAEPSLLLGLGLFTGRPDQALASAGISAVAAAMFGISARLWSAVPVRGRGAPFLGTAGAVLVVGLVLASPFHGAPWLLAAGAVLLAGGLAVRVSGFASSDLLSKAVVVALLVGAGALVAGAGASLGRLAAADGRLEREAARSSLDRERLEEEGPSGWEERVSRPEPRPWTPAGSGTRLSDLARALWLRGRAVDFPEAGDLLTVRDAEGRVLSSFGTMRPGDEGRGTALGLALPVPGTVGVLSRMPWPDADEEDPLLVELLGKARHGLGPVERVDFDGAGRPLGRGRLARAEMSGPRLLEARRSGVSRGTESAAGRRFRTTFRASGPGFVGWSVEAPTTAFILGSTVAAAETALPFALLVLLGGSVAGRVAALLARGKGRTARPFGTFRGRLALALLVSGALPLAAGAVMVGTTLGRSSARATERQALQLLAEGRRLLDERIGGAPSPAELNRAASVVGVDLLLYREGVLAAASRAVPVAAGLAPERLFARIAAALANGASEAAATRGPSRPGGRRVAEAAVTLSREDGTTLAVVVGEDPAGREAVDALVLLAVAVALGALALGGRGALALSRPVEELVAAAEHIGAGEPPGPLGRPATEDLARLVDAFETMSERVRERTDLLEREREAAVSVLRSLTPAAVLFRDADGAILFANPAADALLPPGAKLADRLPAPRFESVVSALANPRPFETRLSLPAEGGETVLRVVLVDLSADAAGQRTLLLLEDLTDFTRAERLEAWVEAARAVAHDIKNPLTPIRLTAERLARSAGRGAPPDAERVVEAASTILRQVDLLTERTGRLSRFASPAAPSRVLLTGEGLAALLGEVASDFAAHPRVRVSCRVGDALPDSLVDRALLRDAVSNFVLNAVEALEAGGGHVELSARRAEGPRGGPAVEVACDDDGPGVAEADLPRLFDPSFSTKSRGSGMGLAAARRAVEEHGGRLFAVRSARGGLRIGFVLPGSAR